MALTIRPTEKMIEELEKLKNKFNLKSASKVIEYAVMNYEMIQGQYEKTKIKLYEKENELVKIKGVIERKRKIDKEYNDLMDRIEFNKKHGLIMEDNG